MPETTILYAPPAELKRCTRVGDDCSSNNRTVDFKIETVFFNRDTGYSRLMVGCFDFNSPLRQYFSLYRAISQREGERGEIRKRRVKCPNE